MIPSDIGLPNHFKRFRSEVKQEETILSLASSQSRFNTIGLKEDKSSMRAKLITVIVKSLGCPTCNVEPGYQCLSKRGLGADFHAKRVMRGKSLLKVIMGKDGSKKS